MIRGNDRRSRGRETIIDLHNEEVGTISHEPVSESRMDRIITMIRGNDNSETKTEKTLLFIIFSAFFAVLLIIACLVIRDESNLDPGEGTILEVTHLPPTSNVNESTTHVNESTTHVYESTISKFKRTELFGDDDGDNLGLHLEISNDGRIFGVLANGYVRVYKHSGTATDSILLRQQIEHEDLGYWELLGEQLNLQPHVDEEKYKYSMSLSGDGNIVAVGFTSENATAAGHVRIYNYTNNMKWEQVGTDITPSSKPLHCTTDCHLFGHSISLSFNGKSIAIGSPSTKNDNGAVYVYSYATSLAASADPSSSSSIKYDWTLVGQTIRGTEHTCSRFGSSLSLSSNGDVLAIGAPFPQHNDARRKRHGYVSIYELLNNTWVQLGHDISDRNPLSQFGASVSLSAHHDSNNKSNDGKEKVKYVVAIGAPKDGEVKHGMARVYNFQDSEWFPVGQTLSETGKGMNMGHDVCICLKGTMLIVGSPALDADNNEGSVMVYALKQEPNDGEPIWHAEDSLDGSDKNLTGDGVGYSVSASYNGKIVVISSPMLSSYGTGSVQVYGL
eukprot:CAMPEP_0195529644 /NCGR_PEP_ID=MMETSP0794_2-20130614/32266_1 /TAXON_ID=515487 /ORGANISM="Stephanopyxis turris, Strain CCMP 815" /LENGTH=558 /DNA_ID=CAMNT_0040660989 /DNA_START=282 /DNA_END=1958 /DNA_ORIENTATION=+